ncbi:MAG: hypothetical protein EXX96DRAFT_604000 [Benjaminiella poitrasii]|nr:MAG: hypothetical protein EXX96DRAFT_604000 [Benjaminiella poitrasii]
MIKNQQNTQSSSSAEIITRSAEHKRQCHGAHMLPTSEDLSYCTPHPHCFCKKPADYIFTLEYGPILQCANYSKSLVVTTNQEINKEQQQGVCGFHIHQDSWTKFSEKLVNGHYICSEYMELRACPMYNFTFCALFGVNNDYRKEPPNWPLCFCNKPVVAYYQQVEPTANHHPPSAYAWANNNWDSKVCMKFICQNLYKDYERKCNWINEANNVLFDKPKFPLHREVSADVEEECIKAYALVVMNYLLRDNARRYERLQDYKRTSCRLEKTINKKVSVITKEIHPLALEYHGLKTCFYIYSGTYPYWVIFKSCSLLGEMVTSFLIKACE